MKEHTTKEEKILANIKPDRLPVVIRQKLGCTRKQAGEISVIFNRKWVVDIRPIALRNGDELDSKINHGERIFSVLDCLTETLEEDPSLLGENLPKIARERYELLSQNTGATNRSLTGKPSWSERSALGRDGARIIQS